MTEVTIDIIKIKIILIVSWKKINSNIIYDLALWKFKQFHEVISTCSNNLIYIYIYIY